MRANLPEIDAEVGEFGGSVILLKYIALGAVEGGCVAGAAPLREAGGPAQVDFELRRLSNRGGADDAQLILSRKLGVVDG